MIYDIKLTPWLQKANIDIIDIISILQHSKPLRSMEIFRKLKEKQQISEAHFAQFSKLLCSVLPEQGLIEVVQSKDGPLYTIAVKKNNKRGKYD